MCKVALILHNYGRGMEYLVESIVHWITSAFIACLKKISRKGGNRWVSNDKKLVYEWDALHSESEVYKVYGNKAYHHGVLLANGIPHQKKH